MTQKIQILKTRWLDDLNPSLKKTLNLFEKRRKKSLPTIVIFDGPSGVGKTTCAVSCASYLNGGVIDFDKQIGFGFNDFERKVNICSDEKLKVCIYDEAGEFSRRGALSRLNARVNEFLDTYRAFNIIVFFCLPDASSLDSPTYKKLLVRAVIRIRRGLYDKVSEGRLWMLKRYFRILEKIKYNPLETYLAYNSTPPNFHFRYSKLPKEIQTKLDTIGIKAKKSMLKARQQVSEGNITRIDIERELGKSRPWVYRAIKELGIKPMAKYNNVSYYEPSVIDKIESYAQKKAERNPIENIQKGFEMP